MEPNLFSYVWKHSRRDQLLVVAVVLVSLPFYFLSLNLPALIVNGPIQGRGFETAEATQPFLQIVVSVFGASAILFDGFPLTRVDSLFALSGLFLALVCVNGLFKFQINTMKGRMGERLLRRLRFELVDRVLRFPVPHFRKVRQSEVASMVKDEVEPIGGFIGDAFALPLFAGGQAFTALLFILVQSFWLGLIAAAVVAVQSILIPRLRAPILKLGRMRQLQARELAGRVGEIVDGIADLRTHDATNYERADITRRLGQIFFIRFEIYQRKFFVKFLNNFLAQVTPFIFYALGGYLAIKGQLGIGELVAVIAAYKDLPAPIKELIDWDLQRQDAQIKYEQVIDQFHPEGLAQEAAQALCVAPVAPIAGRLSLQDVQVLDDSGVKLLESTSFELPLDAHVAFVGPPGQGKETAAQLLARLVHPRGGRMSLGALDFTSLPEAVTGRRIGYAGADAFVFPRSVRDNILIGVRNAPAMPPVFSPAEAREIAKSGNAPYDITRDWTDYARLGATGPEDLDARILALLPFADFEGDVYALGLQSRVSPDRNPDLAEKSLLARARLIERLGDPEFQGVVEPFDARAYNRNATLAENLLFGTPLKPEFEPAQLSGNAQVIDILNETGLGPLLVVAGRSIATTMVELFRDLPADHPFFEQFSFIASAELPEYQAIVNRTGASGPGLSGPGTQGDQRKLMGLAFRYIDARHRLGVIDDEMRAKVLSARARLRARLSLQAPGSVAFYETDRFNPAASLQDNILFGRVAYGQAGAQERIGRLIAEVLDDLDLRPAVLRAGLDFDAGASGRRLTPPQRQKIALLRALAKDPDLLIVNQALSALDPSAQAEIMARVLQARAGRGVVWTLARPDAARGFDRIILFEHGRLAEDRLLHVRAPKPDPMPTLAKEDTPS